MSFGAIPFLFHLLGFVGQQNADHLRKDVHYLASDKLKGRCAATPELERAGRFVARRFRRAGLQPAIAGHWLQAVPVQEDTGEYYNVQIEAGESEFVVSPVTGFATAISPSQFSSSPIIKVDAEYVKSAKGKPLQGRVVVADTFFSMQSIGYPSLIIFASDMSRKLATILPANATVRLDEISGSGATTRIFSSDPKLIEWVHSLPGGPVEGGRATGVTNAEQRKLDLHNVIGVLPGSDPALKNTFVLVSAHYDGLGELSSGTDGIRHGANDDASGTATLIAVASAIHKMPARPKRSIIFAAWSGEETGEVGSRFYARHPLFPPAHTVANINIEQDGRYDGEGGSGPKRLLVTGYGYSEVGKFITEAAKTSGVEAYAGPNEFFARSDNYALAQLGIPAHSVGSSLEFPDYHKVSDSADKLDYKNLALLTDAITAAVVAMANSAHEPQWNSDEVETASYRKARAARAEVR